MPRIGDWPDLAGSRAPSPLLVQYLLDDGLFPLAGMRAAHARLQEIYWAAPETYVGQFYPGPRRFDPEMQDSAVDHLAKWLSR